MMWNRRHGSRSSAASLLYLVVLLWTHAAAGQAIKPHILSASAIAFDPAGNLYIADAKANRIWEATLAGTLLLTAGTGVQGFAGDGGPAAAAELNQPQGLAAGPDGTLYVADTGNGRIRAISPGGVISTIAGSGAAGFGGDGGSSTSALLNGPTALALDNTGRLFLCDTGNHRVRTIAAGIITTVAGSGAQGFSGDGGPALAAALDSPQGVAVTAAGQLLIADTHNHRVRLVGATGLISTLAGNGVSSFLGDGGQASKAELFSPRGLTVASDGAVLVADTGNRRVRRVASDGIITTIAGSGVQGPSSDASAASTSALESPRSLALSIFGLVVIADAEAASVHEDATASTTLYLPAAVVSGRLSSVVAGAAPPSTYGQGSLAVSVSGSVGVPLGQVQLQESSVTLASTALNAGTGTLSLGSLSAGTHSLTLAYLGDGLNPAASTSLQASVLPAELTAAASSASMVYGAAMPALTGALQGVLPSDLSQVTATYSVAAGDLPGVGTYPVQVALTGSRAGNYTLRTAAASGQLTVTKASAAPTLAPVTQAFVSIPLVLSAAVASTTRGQPTGTVQLLDGNTVVGSGTLQNGSASLAYTSGALGSRQLSLQYLGDGNFLPASSAPTTVAVSALPDFTMQSSGSLTASAGPGSIASYTVTVAAQPGPFTGAVSLSATGLPPGGTATFSPPQVIPGTGSATVTISVQVPASSASAGISRGSHLRWCFAGLALAGLAGLRRRGRTSLPRLALCGLLFSIASMLSACGARSVGEGLGGVVSQTYSLQVTGTGTNLAGVVVTHSLPLTLTVLQ